MCWAANPNALHARQPRGNKHTQLMNPTQLSGRTDQRWSDNSVVGLIEPRSPHAAPADLQRDDQTALRKSPAHQSERMILVAVDFTPASLTALDHACVLAKQLQASVLLLHVLNPIFSGRFVNLVTRQKVWMEARRRAWAQIKSLADSHADKGVAVTCAVHDGLPEIEILRLATEMNVNAIVLGRRPRNPLGRWLWGSVSADIIDLAHCPVVLVNHSASWLALNSPSTPQRH